MLCWSYNLDERSKYELNLSSFHMVALVFIFSASSPNNSFPHRTLCSSLHLHVPILTVNLLIILLGQELDGSFARNGVLGIN